MECAFRPLPAIPGLSNRFNRHRPTGAGWIHELKYDGYRSIGRKDGDIVRLWSRNGINWASQFPMIVDAIRRIPMDRIVLYGEAVCLRPDGHPDFRAFRSGQACREARLMAFDLLGLG